MKEVNKIAKQILTPAGIFRKGRSRIWYDDQGWFTTQVEFQPHSWKKGTFLNVGVNFHWYEKNYMSFDIGYRETGFAEFETEAKFQDQITPMVNLSLEKALNYRENLADLAKAKDLMLGYTFSSDELWGNYHRGVICALTGDESQSKSFFAALMAFDHDVPWANVLKERTQELLPMIGNTEQFRQHVLEIIRKTRLATKLPEVEVAFP